MASPDKIPIVDVSGKRMFDYILETISKFNSGAESIKLRAVGRNISRGVEVAQILTTGGFNITNSSTDITTIEMDNRGQFSCIEVSIECKTKPGDSDNSYYNREGFKRDFVEYPVYHVLLDSLLQSRKQVDIQTQYGNDLLTISRSGWDFECRVDDKVLKVQDSERATILGKLTEAYYRSGLLISPVWQKVAGELSTTDDIIIGVDTCILFDAALTEQLLNSLTIIGSRKHSYMPNWLLIVIPSAVMQELERTANIRDSRGFLRFKGRMGFRALQEILELNRARDLVGISLIIVGESNPILDTRLELQALRSDLSYNMGKMIQNLESKDGKDSGKDDNRPSYQSTQTKLSTGDMIIRDQFKQFLRQIDFHKGMYFLTSDKSNAALAQTEGLHSIYYTKPPPYLVKDSLDKPISPQRFRFKKAGGKSFEEMSISVPMGKLIYELTVGFGTIAIRTNKEELKVRCDGKGESLDYWLYKDLMIRKEDIQELIANYDKIGKFSLDKILKVWDYMINPAE